MRYVLLLFLILNLEQAHSQKTVFEILEPFNLRGVYPCKEPTDTLWNSPNLNLLGNWFKDTVVLANDGISGSACNTLSSVHVGQIALFKRNSCNLSEQLINVQNAGATGALVIDSIAGRPLKFLGDSLSNLVTIPFAIISRDQGDDLIDAINTSSNVTVGFGNKTAVNNVDLGIYMPTSLWSSFAYYPLSPWGDSWYFPDTTFGAWVFNKGQQNASDIQLEFYGNTDWGTGDFSMISDSFDLQAGDSVFVSFTQTSYAWDYSELAYGYRILWSGADEDTLDNALESVIYNSNYNGNIVSRTFLNPGWAQDTEVDYILTSDPQSAPQLGLVFKATGFVCADYVNFAGRFDLNSELFINRYAVTAWNPDSLIGFSYTPLETFSTHYPMQEGLFWAESMFYTQGPPTQDTIAISLQHYTPEFFQFGFSTDMYHDERRKQELFTRVYFDNGYTREFLNPVLTEMIFFIASYNYWDCYWGLEESSRAPEVLLVPNPAQNVFAIETEVSIEAVQMWSINGQQIPLNFNVSTKQVHFECESGIYLIYLTDSSGYNFVRQLEVLR